jgi:hypothetical protein
MGLRPTNEDETPQHLPFRSRGGGGKICFFLFFTASGIGMAWSGPFPQPDGKVRNKGQVYSCAPMKSQPIPFWQFCNSDNPFPPKLTKPVNGLSKIKTPAPGRGLE